MVDELNIADAKIQTSTRVFANDELTIRNDTGSKVSKQRSFRERKFIKEL